MGEILDAIDRTCKSRGWGFYALNLIGHGSIVMSDDLGNFDKLRYYARPMPEKTR